MLDKLKEAFRYNLFRGKEGIDYFLNFILVLNRCEDTGLLKEGVRRIDEMCSKTSITLDKVNLTNHKKRLLEKIGDTAGAELSAAEYARLREQMKAERVAGTK